MQDPIAEPWGPPTPIARGERWPERVDLLLPEGVAEDAVERWAQSASFRCRAVLEETGPAGIAFYTSGQVRSEPIESLTVR
jgi:hypothetical protein